MDHAQYICQGNSLKSGVLLVTEYLSEMGPSFLNAQAKCQEGCLIFTPKNTHRLFVY